MYYNVNTVEEKLVSKYTGLNFLELEELSCFAFWAYLRDAVIYQYSQTDEGMDYLDKCWIMEQTNPDRETLRKQFGKS